MRRRAILMILLALVLGGATVWLIQDWVEERVGSVAASKGARTEMTTVVVAAAPLSFGNRLRSSLLTEVEWPANATPPGSFKKIEELLTPSPVGEAGEGGEEKDQERVVLRQIDKGEPVLKSKVSGFGQRASLSAKIAKDMRAATVRVNDILGVAGFILPGDRVDVLLTRTISGKMATDLLLQNIKVLAVDQDAAEAREAPQVARAVTLEVKQRQAQKLTLALNVGTLSLSLRHLGNSASLPGGRRITVSDLETGEVNSPAAPIIKETPEQITAPVSKPRAVPRSRTRSNPMATVKILRGLNESSVKVPQERRSSPVRSPARSEAPIGLSPRAVPSAPQETGSVPTPTPTEKDLDPAGSSPAPGTKPTSLRPQVNFSPVMGLAPPSAS